MDYFLGEPFGPLILGVSVVALFVSVFLGMQLIGAKGSLWYQLAEQFPGQAKPLGVTCSSLSAVLCRAKNSPFGEVGFRGSLATRYNGTLNVVVGPEHLHLSKSLLFRPGQPPLSIPWRRVVARHESDGTRETLWLTVSTKPEIAFGFPMRKSGASLLGAKADLLDSPVEGTPVG